MADRPGTILGGALGWVRREVVPRLRMNLPVERIPEAWRVYLPWLFPQPPIPLVRREDLLVLGLELNGLTIEQEGTGEDRKAVLRPSGGEDGLLIVHLQPQNIAEQAFFETDPDYPPTRPPGKGSDPDQGASDKSPPSAGALPVETLIAGPSRLAFRVPEDAEPIEYTISGILDALRRLELNVPRTALPPQDPPPFFFKPDWMLTLEEALVTTTAEGVGIEGARNLARLHRWEDRSDLVPVTFVGAESLIGLEGNGAGGQRGPQMAEPVSLAERGLIVRGSPRLSVSAVSPSVIERIADLIRRHPQLDEPRDTETALELPFRLIVSPNEHAAWTHADRPVASEDTGAIELWHSRLATRVEKDGVRVVDEGDHRLRTIRAVWARSGPTPDERFTPDLSEPRPGHSNVPFRMSLDAADRYDIVHESANFNIDGYTPEPVRVNRLMLTTLGAWIDSRGQWEPPTPQFEVEEWRHRGTMARDHYVRVVYKGYLWPFGHRASLIKITERKFHPPADPGLPGGPAILRQRMFIIVRQPVLAFADARLKTSDGKSYDRQFPFERVEITTLATPNLDPPEDSDYPDPFLDVTLSNPFQAPGGELQSLFWPRVGGQFFRFHVVAEDLEGKRIEFTAPLLFVSNTKAHKPELLAQVKQHYETQTQGIALATVDLAGQRLALAESAEEGDTTFEAQRLEFGVEVPDEKAMYFLGPDRPRFYPRVRRSHIVIPVVKQFTGAADPTVVEFPDTYLKAGLPSASNGGVNPGQVFLDVVQNTPDLDFSGGGDKAGAFAHPNISVSGISRLMGPVGGNLDTLAGGTFTPTQFFADAKLFGVMDLGDIVQGVTGLVGAEPKDLVPKFVTEAFAAVDAFLKDLERLRADLERLKQEATGDAAALEAQIEAVQDAIVGDITDIGAAVAGLVNGTGDAAALTTPLNGLRGHLNDANALLDALPPGFATEARKALRATVGAFLADLGTAAGTVAAFIDRLTDALQLPEELTMRFDWRPNLQHWPDPGSEQTSIFLARNTKANQAATFVVAAELQAKTKLRPEPKIDVAARLHNFTLNLIGEQSFLLLHFNKLEFTARSGAKPDVNVEFDDIEFTGVLSFVEALRTLIPLDGFSDPPALDVSEEGIKASFSMALPDIAVGVFSMQNLSLGAGFTVPFLVDPLSVRFNFCERQEPFLLTVSMFGGGGFFGITLDPGGVQILEAAFEFGASLSVNLGVASGGVTVMAGIYYKMEIDEASLTGYFRLRGEVDVLGLISACIELYMGLTYEFASGKCVGRAQITVEIEIAFFETSVTISHERKFAGSDGDPTFAELMAPGPDVPGDPWAEYCEAFA